MVGLQGESTFLVKEYGFHSFMGSLLQSLSHAEIVPTKFTLRFYRRCDISLVEAKG